eukprot:3822210-Pleurochrysis_carterae.AAC.2
MFVCASSSLYPIDERTSFFPSSSLRVASEFDETGVMIESDGGADAGAVADADAESVAPTLAKRGEVQKEETLVSNACVCEHEGASRSSSPSISDPSLTHFPSFAASKPSALPAPRARSRSRTIWLIVALSSEITFERQTSTRSRGPRCHPRFAESTKLRNRD